MGITIHYKLRFQPPHADLAELEARRLVEEARKVALSFRRRGRVDAVGRIGDDFEARKLAEANAKYRHPEYGKQWAEVLPERAWMFVVEVGRDCEPLRLGLGRYPARVRHLGGEWPTRLARGWRFAGFSKTQFASMHGWEHFRRCHVAVVDLLVALRPLGFRVRLSDEGDYWPHRSLRTLQAGIGLMDRNLAAFAGALKDRFGEDVQSPILRHPDFERLEAEGQDGPAGRFAATLERIP